MAHANCPIQECGGKFSCSIADFDAIKGIPKTKLGRKLRNFTLVRQEINEHSNMTLFRIRDDKLLLRHVHDAKRWNEGEELTQDLFEPTGPRQLKPEVAFQMRHVLFAFPKIGMP